MNPDLIRRWQRGWAHCRGLPAAAESGGALHVVLGLADRHTELVALSDDDQTLSTLADLAASALDPTWLTVITSRAAQAGEVIRSYGLTVAPAGETFMTAELAAGEPVDTGMEVRIHPGDSTVRVELADDRGAVVARGMAGFEGDDAVPHDVYTAPAHRGRGLGATVMGVLTDQALARGAKHGLLIASPAGRRLYDRLGWTAHGDVLVARRASAG